PAEDGEPSAPERDAEVPVTGKPEPAPPTPEEELAELRDRYLRLAADFDNFRKRQLAQGRLVRAEAYRTLLASILPAVDDLHLAAAHDTADEAYRAGILRVIEKLDAALAAVGVERMDPLGQPFDPRFHECLAVQPAPEAEPGTVIGVHAYGYLWGDVVLRPAQVIVAQPPPDDDINEQEE
ncbi:MAG: nucleotide exchange factor GrpE, partial [bacterium]|nr:nucleotide exchange factor GrpE [bacterium]